MAGLAGDSIGIRHLKSALVFRTGIQVENAAGKTIRNGIVKMLARAKYPFSADSQKRHGIAPRSFSDCSELDSNVGIAIGIAGETPLEAKIQQGGMLDGEFTGDGSVLSVGHSVDRKEKAEETNDCLHWILEMQIKQAQSLERCIIALVAVGFGGRQEI